ncbi:MAG: hypothetical protein IJV56_10400, partial [Neisseriaceae bacterium]|nr:hypothetical protein [Neisseriaceae bacterium]
MLKISTQFDGGSIEVISVDDPQNIQVRLRQDNAADFRQWFYFRLQGAAYSPCVIDFGNVEDTAYPAGWENYQAVASYDRKNWFRVPTEFNSGSLKIHHTPLANSVYYAYFEPYSYEQHLNLLGDCQGSGLCQIEDLGSTLDGRDLNLLTIGNQMASDIKIWLIARQHPGETMAEWLAEGFLTRLLDFQDSLSRTLLDMATVFVVPNMNPDGSVRGNLRTNAAGANLNREWANTTMEKSPVVFLVREKIQQTGEDILLDIQGDESIP